MIVTLAVAGSQYGASGAPNWVTGESVIISESSFFLAHRLLRHACGHGSLIAFRIRILGPQRTIRADHKVRLYIVALEHLLRESDGIFLTKLFARTDVDVYLAVFRPGMHADMALRDHHKTRHSRVERIGGLDIVQMNRADFFHVNPRRVLVQHTPQQRLLT